MDAFLRESEHMRNCVKWEDAVAIFTAHLNHAGITIRVFV
ncbi:hypothetical protein NTGM5_180060 [Candidatus Nitrotoga sp. M5]|nr:hypothetical protein NTGM5_180060 [Candidatus Nitrotoga sp. M5]